MDDGYSFIYGLITYIIGVSLYLMILRAFETRSDERSKKRINDFLNSDEYKIKNYGRYYLNKYYPIFGGYHPKYSNNCWKCKGTIDSERCIKCPSCGWYICNSCGSCKRGCSSGKIIQKEAENFIYEVSSLPDDNPKKIIYNSLRKEHLMFYIKERYPKAKSQNEINYFLNYLIGDNIKQKKYINNPYYLKKEDRINSSNQCNNQITEEEKRKLLKKLNKLKKGKIIVHKKFGKLKVVRINSEYIYTVSMDKKEEKYFVNNESLIKYINDII